MCLEHFCQNVYSVMLHVTESNISGHDDHQRSHYQEAKLEVGIHGHSSQLHRSWEGRGWSCCLNSVYLMRHSLLMYFSCWRHSLIMYFSSWRHSLLMYFSCWRHSLIMYLSCWRHSLLMYLSCRRHSLLMYFSCWTYVDVVLAIGHCGFQWGYIRDSTHEHCH